MTAIHLSPRQKRLRNAFRRAALDLAAEAVRDPAFCNLALTDLATHTGSILGQGAAAARFDDAALRRAATGIGGRIGAVAAETYALKALGPASPNAARA